MLMLMLLLLPLLLAVLLLLPMVLLALLLPLDHGAALHGEHPAAAHLHGGGVRRHLLPRPE